MPSTAQRVAAATASAQSSGNACSAVRPFYWEIGDRSAALASGSVPGNPGSASYSATSSLPLASASKWLYAAYLVQKQAGILSASDLKFVSFTSGYTTFSGCPALQSVDACVSYQSNGVYTAASDGCFSYGGAHMEQHASLTGLGSLTNAPRPSSCALSSAATWA